MQHFHGMIVLGGDIWEMLALGSICEQMGPGWLLWLGLANGGLLF